MAYSYEKLRAAAMEKGAPRYIYEPIGEQLTPRMDFECLPDYFMPQVDLANARVRRLLSDRKSCEAFVFFADAHVRQNGMASVPIIRSILENTGIETVIYGGDTVSAWVNEETALEDVLYFKEAFSFAKPYMVRGNHDIYGKEFGIADRGIVLPGDKVYDLIFSEGASRVHGEKGKTYYYFDHADTKTRYIVVDTNEQLTPVWDQDGIWDCSVGVTREQIEWFAAQLRALPAGYAAVVVGHIPFFEQLRWSNPIAHIFGKLIEAYNKRRMVFGVRGADFREARGLVLLTLSGHGHCDDAYVSPDGCVNLETHCDAMTDNGGSRYKKRRGTVTESVVDVVILDRKTGDVFTVRYGAGADRRFLRKGNGNRT
ncbi:MAG: metallophosphoesterase [Ruminococcaceae bacterium]|nr:metallophosphoesterase [Oscillospiraceae bacterium]